MVFLLDDQNPSRIPNPKEADENGMVAVSESLGVERLISAYRTGLFPWMKMEQEPNFWCWFSPDPRMVLHPKNFKTSRSLKKALVHEQFEIRVDQNFRQTMEACARSPRPNQESTWIEKEMIDDYEKLHKMGIAHSLEAFIGNEMVGGLYGLAFGKMFFGESMYHTVPEASKVCLAHLIKISKKFGIAMIDCQAHTNHLEKMGAAEIPRGEFTQKLGILLNESISVVPWDKLSESSNLARLL